MRQFLRTSQPLEIAFNPRSNAIGLLRLVLAPMVLFSHAFLIARYDNGDDPLVVLSHNHVSIGQFTVCGFSC